METCKICHQDFKGPDSLVLCDHWDGFIHFGCCTRRCSKDGEPCQHCEGIFDRTSQRMQ
ncbi:hypothetical protein GOV09_02905 [Candidatus Woesearchaeota archaeon]|nr:hypothetical protein [Candidatus Woesearchaeota archaeon]